MQLMHCHAPEVVLSGPAGTGKTRACLEKLHLVAATVPKLRALMVRKTAASLAASALETYKSRVLHPLDSVTFFGGSAQDPPHFKYPNGSRIIVGGMDKPTKIMSTEYDLAYVPEATELTLEDWESITTRLRNGVLPYQQLMGDCNPGQPMHWLKRRADAGQTVMFESRHVDNPSVTADYLAKLDALTGVRKLRLRDGLWAAAEGLVYDGWDAALHLIPPFPIPPAWPRYLAVDFGYTNPFVCQWWAEDPDGRLYRYRELYRTQGLVEDHAKTIAAASQREPRPRLVVCDHDAEDRATLDRKLGWGTVAAHKDVSPGIQAVAARLRRAGDGKPRLYLLRDALLSRDMTLEDAHKPCCTEEEIESYIWDTSANRRTGEAPLKQHDHGMDAMRYLVAQRDLRGEANVRWIG